MEVAELTGAMLDKWVGKACGYDIDEYGENRTIRDNGGAPSSWNPSTDWAHGGPIIDRHKISTQFDFTQWQAIKADEDGWVKLIEQHPREYGPTALIAAMRAFVASKYGETVPDE